VIRLIWLCLLLLAGAAHAQTDSQVDQIAARLADIRTNLRSRQASVLGLIGYNMTPDGATNSLQISRGSTAPSGSSNVLQLGQYGSGFTVAESLPLYMEGFIGTARYDPRAIFSGGETSRPVPLRWNNIASTIGLGWDIKLMDNLYLRPIINGSLGIMASDVALFGGFIRYRTGRDFPLLTDRHVNVYGLGGAITVAWYDYRPEFIFETELRYTGLALQTFGDTLPAARGASNARTLGLWTRYRWPTGIEAFGRETRWVLEGSASWYPGAQTQNLGYTWAARIGGGFEFDTGRYEFGAFGLNVNRVRLTGSYFFGDKGVTGLSFGLGLSF
jgi:hypothetical protein